MGRVSGRRRPYAGIDPIIAVVNPMEPDDHAVEQCLDSGGNGVALVVWSGQVGQDIRERPLTQKRVPVPRVRSG